MNLDINGNKSTNPSIHKFFHFESFGNIFCKILDEELNSQSQSFLLRVFLDWYDASCRSCNWITDIPSKNITHIELENLVKNWYDHLGLASQNFLLKVFLNWVNQSQSPLLKVFLDWYNDIPITNIPTNVIRSLRHNNRETSSSNSIKNYIKELPPKSKKKIKQMILGLQKGDIMSPILIDKYGDVHYLVDGQHRLYAYVLSKRDSIPSKIITHIELENLVKNWYDQLNLESQNFLLKVFLDWVNRSENFLLKVFLDWYNDIPITNVPTNIIRHFNIYVKMSSSNSIKNYIRELPSKSKKKIKQMILDIQKGDIMPPILIDKYRDVHICPRDVHYLVDGQHRLCAYVLSKRDSIPSKIITHIELENLVKNWHDQLKKYEGKNFPIIRNHLIIAVV
jgi:hypothetical protein